MSRYLLRRGLTIIPTLFLLSLLVFWLGAVVDEDPALRELTDAAARSASEDPGSYDRAYRRAAGALGLNRPWFYVSLNPAAYPDTFHRIVRPEQREVLLNLLHQYGNWPALQAYYKGLRGLAYSRRDSVGSAARELLLHDDPAKIEARLANGLLPPEVNRAFERMRDDPRRAALLWPKIRWHGTDNRYHHWLMRTLGGDLGRSSLDRRPVASKIGPALRWTALINGLAIFFAYLIAVPVGMYAARYRGGKADRFFNLFFLLLFSLPGFWAASLLSTFITTPAYGMDWFPTLGVGEIPAGAGWWEIIGVRAHHLFLPVLCLTYPSLAYLSRQMRSAAVAEYAKDYVRTARAKGLSEGRIAWGHVFRNASFPLITMLASLLPALLAGSVLIEMIFNLPGMGRLLIQATLSSDWNVVMAITLLNGLLTVAGIVLADLGYALADPRVRLADPTSPAR